MIPFSKPGAAVELGPVPGPKGGPTTGPVVGAGWCGLGPQGCAGLQLLGPYLLYVHLVGLLKDLADLKSSRF